MSYPGSDVTLARLRARLRWCAFMPLLCCLGCTAQKANTSVFSSFSTPAHNITRLGYFVLGVTGGICFTMYALLVYAIVRYRACSSDVDVEPPQVFGSTEIELSWTIIPVLIIIVLFLTTAGVIFGLQDAPKPSSALEVVVVGHQFWWEYRYPQFGVVAANELHVPVSETNRSRPTFMKLTSADVNHSFWVPQLAGKTDVLPNRVNELWLDPHVPGVYEGQCSLLCGVQHGKMLLVVHVDRPEDFDAWVRQQQQTAVQSEQVAAGRHVFETESCINCHSIRGTIANGRFGPDLTHLMSRKTLASGAIENTPENLKRWVAHPDVFKPGVLMPSMQLSQEQLDELTAYLTTLN